MANDHGWWANIRNKKLWFFFFMITSPVCCVMVVAHFHSSTFPKGKHKYKKKNVHGQAKSWADKVLGLNRFFILFLNCLSVWILVDCTFTAYQPVKRCISKDFGGKKKKARDCLNSNSNFKMIRCKKRVGPAFSSSLSSLFFCFAIFKLDVNWRFDPDSMYASSKCQRYRFRTPLCVCRPFHYTQHSDIGL